jgi:hypothetical protein
MELCPNKKYRPYKFDLISASRMMELLREVKGNIEHWLDACEDEEQEIYRYWMSKQSPKLRLFEAMETFKEDLPKFLRNKKYFDPDGGDWSLIERYLSDENWKNTERARSVMMEDVLDSLGIQHNHRRCTSPFDPTSTNKQTFAFKDNLYRCFRSGNKGDAINFVMKLTGKTFHETISYLNTI